MTRLPLDIGIELGSTRIKAVAIGPDFTPVASGAHDWENEFSGRLWTYSLDAVWEGVRGAVAALIDDADAKSLLDDDGALPVASLGVSAMMHGYLAFDSGGQLLVPFRTWRNTNTGPAAAQLSERLNFNVPLRWSVAHVGQAALDGESHVPQLAFLTTLAGYVHWQLTGQRVLGVGDASGMFPTDPATGGYDAARLALADALLSEWGLGTPLERLLPAPLPAGAPAGELSAAGAALLDPAGRIHPGVPLAPPEGDAGTGMVATASVRPRTGNVSVGTSIFAMIVLERGLEAVHPEVDIVTTPAGDPVAMVHCNNGASELDAWAGVLKQFAAAAGADIPKGRVFDALLQAALESDDAGGVLSYNTLSGEPILGIAEGRPLVVRSPGSALTFASFARSQAYGVFATLSLGMRVLADEGVQVDSLYAHGGLFRTPHAPQQILADALQTAVTVGTTAGEGGPWGMALLAAYRRDSRGLELADFLDQQVFATAERIQAQPDPEGAAAFAAYLERYRAGVAVQQAAVEALR